MKRSLEEMKRGLVGAYDFLDLEDFEGVSNARDLVGCALTLGCDGNQDERVAARLVNAMTGEDYDDLLREVEKFVNEYKVGEMTKEDKELMGYDEESYEEVMGALKEHTFEGEEVDDGWYADWVKCMLFIYRKIA